MVAPDWTLSTADHIAINLDAAVQQKATILLFRAAWCPCCEALMPHLQSIAHEYQDSVQILAINVFDDGAPVAFIDGAAYDFTLLLHGEREPDRTWRK